MSLQWIRETPAFWDANKHVILSGAPPGAFDLARFQAGDLAPGDWWRVEIDGRIVGYGWMDVVWGDGEVLLAVDPAFQGQGIGAAILENLASEARSAGLRRIYNVVAAAHPRKAEVTAWLEKNGFVADADGTLHLDLRRG